MEKVASILKSKADELRSSTPELVAIHMLKQAGLSNEEARLQVAQTSMEKVACEALTFKGIDAEEAAKLVKAANINVRELQSLELSSPEEDMANFLDKAAAYVDALEDKVVQLESDLEKAAQAAVAAKEVKETIEDVVPEPLRKMASLGALSEEDMAALSVIPKDTLIKVASAVDEPWSLGQASGFARPKTDPLLEFLLS